jgi:hypothetical protein
MMLVLVNGQCLQESHPFGYWLLVAAVVQVRELVTFIGQLVAAAVQWLRIVQYPLLQETK